MITIKTSIGDALDRLSILEIKKEHIKDKEKLKNITKEYNNLKNEVKSYADVDSFNFKILKKVNKQIWDTMDELRINLNKKEKEKNKEEKLLNSMDLYHKIAIDYNDRRFRIKRKINNQADSAFKECKSYAKKVAFHIGDLGLGDQFGQIGAIRYLSIRYDKVIVVCKKNNEKNMRQVFSDDDDIELYIINTESDIIPKYGCSMEKYNEITKNTDVYMTGCNLPHGGGGPFNYIVTKPYEYLNFDFSDIYWNYFHIPNTEESVDLYEILKDKDYNFIHNTTSGGKLFTLDNISNDIIDKNKLIINPCYNMYDEDHEFYDIAEKFINKPILSYIETIKNANSIILSDSSFFCLSINLDIKTEKCYYISRWHNYDHIWNQDNIFDRNCVNRKIFKAFKIFKLDELKYQLEKLNSNIKIKENEK